ncbi:MAG: hypothetical protein GX869_07625 [Candidatus Cloacimonetes bacterium]|nr:hypothetical protein [Candidatus Cloacimonadota bacterium]
MELREVKGDKILKIRERDFSSSNCKWSTVWELEVDGALSTFRTDDVNRNESLGAYIEFSEFSQVAKYFAKLNNQKVKDLRIRISNDNYNEIHRIEKENSEKRLQEEFSKELRNWSWWLDENYQICIYSDDVDFTLRNDVEDIMDFVQKYQGEFKEYLKDNSEYDRENEKYRITNEKLMTIYNQVKNEYDYKVQQEAKEQKEKIQSLIEKAKETGKSQFVRKWAEDCDGSVSDCDLDEVYEYIDANGKFSYERVHTF